MKKILLLLLLFLSLSALNAVGKDRFVLVIDAGHGGHDSGATGKYSKEKDLTLKFALAFGKMVERNCRDVKVIYTRTTDRFLPLVDRAEIANKNKADLFISVHINSIGGGRIARGFQTYTLGSGRNTGRSGLTKNLEVAKRENSVILLEKGYKQTYQGFDPNSAESNIMFELIQDKNMERSVELARYMQRCVPAATGRNDMGAHQDNLAVLRLSSMPGCLLELGFISTPEEEDFMNSAQAPELYARGVYNAFVMYKNKYDIYGKPATRIDIPPTAPTRLPEKEQPTTKPGNTGQPAKTTPATQKTTQAQPAKNAAQPDKTTPSTVKKPTNEAVRQDEPARTQAQTATTGVIFKVQVMASQATIPANDTRLKGLNDVDHYTEDGLVKYTVGATPDYSAAVKLRGQLLERFPQAFIIAFVNGKKTTVKDAIQQAGKQPTK